MKSYRIAFATVTALGITSLAGLAMHVSIAGVLLIVPGLPLGIVFGFLTRSDSFLVLPVSVFFAYFLLTLAVTSMRARRVTASTWRRWTLVSIVPTAGLTILACIPRFDPMLPNGVTALKTKEANLASRIHDGDGLAQVEEVLRLECVTYTEDFAGEDLTVFSRGEDKLRAYAGDRVLVHFGPSEPNRTRDAYQFPCGYDLHVVLVFGKDERLRQHYIGEFPLCP